MSSPKPEHQQIKPQPTYGATIGPENGTLILSTEQNWIADPDNVEIVCRRGWVNLDDWR